MEFNRRWLAEFRPLGIGARSNYSLCAGRRHDCRTHEAIEARYKGNMMTKTNRVLKEVESKQWQRG
jgi:hypothetical protein